ncbi:MAG: acetyltransferase [Bdellovibrionota bacterium]
MSDPAKKKKLVLFGTGEIASLAKFYFTKDSAYEVVAFTADDEFATAKEFEGLPLVPFSQVTSQFPPTQYEMHVALSYRKLNRIRHEKYLAAKKAGYRLASYVCSKSVTWDDLTIGDNCFILENQTIQPTVKIGNNVMIWSGNHLGHGCTVEDNVYMASHICISGHARIGAFTFIGVNAAVRDFATIGSDCFIAMNAAVTRDVKPGSVVVGAKGTIFDAETAEAQALKKKYFFS